MLHHIKKLFGIKPKEIQPDAPYKVETPVQPVVNNPGLDPVTVALDLEPLTDLEPAKKVRKPRAKKINVDETVVTEKKPRKPRAPRKPKAD